MAANIPYGNAFLVNTPALDQLEQRLYTEERQRQAQNQASAKALDDEFSKNVSNIRDADVDDLTKAYQDYKQSAQATMRKKDGVSPKEQMEVLRKKAAMYKLITESKAEREREELEGKRYVTKPDDYNEDAAELFIKGRQLPLSQKKSYKKVGADGKEVVIDLTNPEIYRWQDKTNWQPILQKAGGTLMQRGQPVVVDLPGGLEQEITTYKAGNDPVEYYQSIVGAMNTPRASQSLASRYNFTPEEAQDIMMKFEELKKTPAFKNAYGDVKFPESAGISQGGKTAMLLAMTNAINNPPTANAPVRKANLAAVTANRQNFAKEQQQRAQTFSFNQLTRMINARQLPWMNATDMANFIIDRDNEEAGATPEGVVKTDDAKYKTITGNDYSSTSQLRSDGNGGYIYGKVGTDGKFIERGRVSAEEAKDRLIKAAPKNPVNVTPETRLPKDIKSTKTSWKDRAKKVN